MSDVQQKIKKYRRKMFAIVFWVACWQLLSMVIDNNISLASPAQVIQSLFGLVQTKDFWVTVFSSITKIGGGFFLAVLIGNLLALVTSCFEMIKEITQVIMQIIKSIPVASFIILALLWIKSNNLSILISFLMVLPIIYSNVMKGIESTDRKLLEMAKVYRMTNAKKLRYIYLPAILPYFVSACTVGLGFCWKSGIAAEIIGIANNSIGGRLYEAKIYLNTEELFAWTVVIVCISIFFEKLVMYLIRKASRMIIKAKAEG